MATVQYIMALEAGFPVLPGQEIRIDEPLPYEAVAFIPEFVMVQDYGDWMLSAFAIHGEVIEFAPAVMHGKAVYKLRRKRTAQTRMTITVAARAQKHGLGPLRAWVCGQAVMASASDDRSRTDARSPR